MKSILAILLMFVTLTSTAQVTVKTTQGESIEGSEATLEVGRLKLKIEGGSSRSFDRKDLKQVIMAEPQDLLNIRHLFYAGKYPDVIALKPKADGLKLMGWGKWAAYFIARSQIAIGKADEGRKVLFEYESCVDGGNITAGSLLIKLGLAETNIAMGKTTDAETFLLNATNKYDSSVRHFVSVARAHLYFAQGKFENAKLEHLKVALCDSQDAESQLSLREVDGILKKLQDPRGGKPLPLSSSTND